MVRSFYLINVATILLLVGIIVREVWQMVLARRRGRAAARLHIQVVGLFSVIAVLPAVLVAIIANVTIDRGLDRLVSGSTREVIQNSLTIANAYVQEHAQLIRGDIIGMAADVSHARPLFDQDRRSFNELLTASAAARNLPGAMIIDKDTHILVAADTGIQLTYSPPGPDFLANVNENEPEIAVLPDSNYVAAVIRLRVFTQTFLYVVRVLDPRVVEQLKQTQASVAGLQRMGIATARHPGGLCADVRGDRAHDPDVLGAARPEFRQPPGGADPPADERCEPRLDRRPQGAGSRHEVGGRSRPARRDLQQDDVGIAQPARRAGQRIRGDRQPPPLHRGGAVLGLCRHHRGRRLRLGRHLNRSAEKLIGHAEFETLDHPLSDVLPELDEMMKTAREGNQRLVQGQVTILRDGNERNLSVRVSAEKTSEATRDSYIITLDDITELVSAQRTSAWGDVARRIAHEIKNPLTPIQLSAERIRRKFGKVITEDKAVFDQCTDTIVRQVDDIRRMVDEFSRFARMPKPVIEGEDVADTVRQAVFLMKVAHPEIDIETEIKEDTLGCSSTAG